jgi:predicted metal-dependent hydrolase
VRSDCSVYVSANNRVADSVIEEFLNKKADFIFTAIDKYSEIAKYASTTHQYVTGESFRYIGKDLRLVVITGKNNVNSDGIYLTLIVTDIDNKTLKEKLIKKWYNTKSLEIFTEALNAIYPIFQKYGVKMPKLTLRDMTSRWGSCQPKRGVITLNKKLIETPINAIEYVVMHEFVHFLHPNHSTKFYETLTTLMPDWEERKKHLESVAFRYSE